MTVQRRNDSKRIGIRRGLLLTTLLAVLIGAPRAYAAVELSDQGISDAIELDLLTDRAVLADRIDVLTNEGIVRLSGHVNNLLAKERAERIAETVRGVRSVVNTIEVVALQRPNADLRQDIKDALLANPATESYEIDVKAEAGAVTLTGKVSSWQEKNLAEKVAKRIRGVIRVENDLQIRYEEARSDADIRADVEQALRWNRLVDNALIQVAVDDGTVKLTGKVGSLAEKRQARFDAWTAGVKDVDDTGLTVAYWARDDQLRTDKYGVKSDAAVTDAIKKALVYDPRVASFNVEVSAASGIATLRGAVESLGAKRAAAETARNTVGVWRVRNLIKVRPDGPPADATIESRVRNALQRDPYIEPYGVESSVTNGVVYLSGVVSSYFEKAQAEDVVSDVNGTVSVVNNLRVANSRLPLLYDPFIADYYPYDYDWYSYAPAPPFKADWAIREDIDSEMWWSPFVDADEVAVSVDNGVATLTGDVDSFLERNAAIENAYEGGAVAVIDKINVEYGPTI